MLGSIKRLLIGTPIPSELQHHQRLRKITALAVFSSDALSSVAYATEAILSVLIVGGAAGVVYGVPIAIAICGLLVIIAISYQQTIKAYPNGGGAYTVARENLGETAGLIAAGALLVDYVLTVAVSISAGVSAITSLATNWGAPGLTKYAVLIGVLCILVVTLANLRGIKESGFVFSIPTYLFIGSVLTLLVFGLIQQPQASHNNAGLALLPQTEFVGAWLLLRAFAAGCTALTGIEAISNGIPAFQKPESRNAAVTLRWMVALLGTMFLGISYFASTHGLIPNEHTNETILSQVARTVFGIGPMYTVIQVATALILILAANTAYADFPRLASLLARDKFLPGQLTSRGDRLVYSNGITVLAILAIALVYAFDANEIMMLPMYAIGVFISFSLSQIGMVRHHLTLREAGWIHGIVINGVGGILSCIVLIMLTITKFSHGAWAVVFLIPLFVGLFTIIKRHYVSLASQLTLTQTSPLPPVKRLTAVILVGGLHRGTLPALQLAKAIAPDNIHAVTVDVDHEQTQRVVERWNQWEPKIPLVVLDSPYRSLIQPIRAYLRICDAQYSDDEVLVFLPEFVPARWWEHLLHNQTGFMLKTALLLWEGKTVISVPYKLN